MIANSPLRYPGGKSVLYRLVSEILVANKLNRGSYAEPYAGGGGLALSLLYGGFVSELYLNDLDPAIWSFWSSVVNETNALVELVEETPITVEEWYRQRETHLAGDISNPLELGFSAFFLNRTNRSGIITNAGIIGGYEQKGNYKIDCRFNRADLARRIRRIARYKSQIQISCLDAVDFMVNSDIPEDVFLCIDPPYFNKGSSLYTSFYEADDHAEVATAVRSLSNPWILTYDDAEEIRELYKDHRQFNFDLNYSVQKKRKGTELFVASKGLKVSRQLQNYYSRAA